MTARWSRTAIVTAVGIAAVVLGFAACAWSRRWLSDDGLIFVRIVRQILAGHGPVFNALERAEANTSALWPWLVAAIAFATGGDAAAIATYAGLACSVGGLALALDGTRRWQRARGCSSMLVPAAALIVLAVFPFWDYATSGLETGLTTLWLGMIWWLLVALATLGARGAETTPRRAYATAVVLGLGPLVRPDLAVASGAFLVAGWALVRPSRRRTVALAAAAAALPLGYEIFRAGFYGALVPLPALAKGATHSVWSRGITYLITFVQPFALWVPFGILAGVCAFAIARRRITPRDRIVIAAPAVSAAVMALYVVRVGGDFMYARMLLPPTFLLALPALVWPLRRVTAAPLAAIALWAAVVGPRLDDHQSHASGGLVEDEHVGYVHWTQTHHPDEAAYIAAGGTVSTRVLDAERDRQRLFITEGGVTYALDPAAPSIVFIAGRLGLGGTLAPLDDGFTADTLGLANPLGARIPITLPEEVPGHQKQLPYAWLFADFGDPAHDADTGAGPRMIQAARHAMTCGALAELMASVREPMSASRFFANLAGAVARTRLEVPADPFDAEEKFCGHREQPEIFASSSCEQWGWGKTNVIDGLHETVIGRALGYSSQVWAKTDHTEWLVAQFREPRVISQVVLFPRTDRGFVGAGFPIDFEIQTWDAATNMWLPRVIKLGYPVPDGSPQTFAFNGPVTTDRVRIYATHLQNDRVDGYVMQLAEIEFH